MSTELLGHEQSLVRAKAGEYRAHDKRFAEWAEGYGVISHDPLTQCRVYELANELVSLGQLPDRSAVLDLFIAADRVASAGMWLVVHMTYAKSVRPDGQPLQPSDFKDNPEGHTGGALNMVPAYTGYLLANALSGETRSWLMGQGHCVAAIDALNLIVENLSERQAERYGWDRDRLSRFVSDFYSCQIDAEGRPVSPLGSHVNATTAGGMIEGGYLGFAELMYPHMPLPEEKLVAFLSDGAFEEQRGSDWAPRWWRAEDTGLVSPIMIANGRRIDQRSSMAQDGGVDWFRRHLALNGFDPIDLDGTDPASIAWGILQIEARLKACSAAIQRGEMQYPVRLHYGIAETVKGFGFPGAGTNRAHNLPLEGSPAEDESMRALFQSGAEKLFVPADLLRRSVMTMNNHAATIRPKERDHPMIARDPCDLAHPEPEWLAEEEAGSPMAAIDRYVAALFRQNEDVRIRVGNPDEMRSNRMNETLDLLKHRVCSPEEGIAEAVDGRVITALNEEAVVCAALANKAGLALVVSYEAFAVKMLGAIRQDLIFSRHLKESGKPLHWTSLPIISTSHVWENGKNELSHQDPTLCEALLGEMSDMCRVVFPADANSAAGVIEQAYKSRGEIWNIICPKRNMRSFFTPRDARRLAEDGAVRLRGNGDEALVLTAIGGYQLEQACLASARLEESGLSNSLIYMAEPGRFRAPRDGLEARHLAQRQLVEDLFPSNARARVFVTHGRAEPIAGCLRPLDTGPQQTIYLGFRNRGGTLDVRGMLYANKQSWAHIVEQACRASGKRPDTILTSSEMAVLGGEKAPDAGFWASFEG
ncbi:MULTISPECIES: phosphoketolase family protein [Alphaproteobacteria]|jgi:phosphoketolase|uniref:Xylulose 5-phosphate/Fructose 6-phosphate phosphoketolase N-terminal domain-containing protein n=1 Tax=Maricaulis virginensis TaxID=144022 RepID=A0A9W6INA6_9PROT|nr:xylulose 5-phosphate 3-epimerase [Maricaulis virginensis]GLK53478.1 hypothetical protein GCM10017621_29860 [Maricaulis virginensis]